MRKEANSSTEKQVTKIEFNIDEIKIHEIYHDLIIRTNKGNEDKKQKTWSLKSGKLES